MFLSKKSEEIIKLCGEARFYIDGHKKDEEVANRMIAEILKVVIQGTKCETDVKEVLNVYWEMKNNSKQSYRG